MNDVKDRKQPGVSVTWVRQPGKLGRVRHSHVAVMELVAKGEANQLTEMRRPFLELD